MFLEKNLREDIRHPLGVVERNRKVLTQNEILGGNSSFTEALEKFYDICGTRKKNYDASNPEVGFSKGEGDLTKNAMVPRELINVLSDFSLDLDDRLNLSVNELSYKNVRDALFLPCYSQKNLGMTVGLNFVGLYSAMLPGMRLLDGDINPSLLMTTAAGFVGLGISFSLPFIVLKDRRPESVKQRCQAFGEVYQSSLEFDSFLESYNKIFK
jgi:hypothetical protein